MTVDLLGALPTVRKAYAAPAEESLFSWAVFLVADILNLCAIGSWSVATVLYPLYLFSLAGMLVLLMLRPSFSNTASSWSSGVMRSAARKI